MQYSLITSVGPIYNQYNISFTTTHTLLLQLTPYLLRFYDKLFQNVVFQTTVSFTLCLGSKFTHMVAINSDEEELNNTMATTKPDCTQVETSWDLSVSCQLRKTKLLF